MLMVGLGYIVHALRHAAARSSGWPTADASYIVRRLPSIAQAQTASDLCALGILREAESRVAVYDWMIHWVSPIMCCGLYMPTTCNFVEFTQGRLVLSIFRAHILRQHIINTWSVYSRFKITSTCRRVLKFSEFVGNWMLYTRLYFHTFCYMSSLYLFSPNLILLFFRRK
jgi:hypothetical protein